MNKVWNIPISWSMSAIVSVKADTLAEAIELEKQRPLPPNGGEYVPDSFTIEMEDCPEEIRALHNDNQADETDAENGMSYEDLKARFREAEAAGKHLIGHIVFTEDSFDKPYSEEERTYVVSSDNKAFQPHMGGYSIFGTSLDGSDKHVRLDAYMAEEYAGEDGWKVERCYILENGQEEKQ